MYFLLFFYSLHDLIVAAPFYFNATAEEGGAVYIYLHDPNRRLNDVTPIKLTGKFESRYNIGFLVLYSMIETR